MSTLAVGAPPRIKTADQLRAERRDRVTVVRALVGRTLELIQAAVLSLGLLLVLIAG